ncbi:hypothetical protein HZS55_21080 [Halosimplex rubrum]|uniref:DUF7123 domain-containing protein n=1 Tax=Halosimplex rubrum TaxID=869889 RepID=A0A7D5T999_9EURY|nr:hypothetical protein [Halosimplex rubrum]QLH79635.1 hypothetical protein HZS55_21080 [Halosimplex rubrum]
MPTPAGRNGSIARPSLSETQARLLSYLCDRVDGTAYLKAKYVADDLDLSSKEVGINMGILADRTDDVTIEQWGRSSSTTWKVSAGE